VFERNKNFEHKIFPKQEGLIKKITNHSQKPKETKLKFSKESKNNVFEGLFFFKKQ